MKRRGGPPSRPDSISIVGRPRFGQIPRALLRDPSISAQAKTLWALLEDHSSPDSPRPFPGKKLLGDMLGVHQRTIQNWTEELAKAGWLGVERGGRGRSNRYVLYWDGSGLDEQSIATLSPVVKSALDEQSIAHEVDLAADQLAETSRRSATGPGKAKKEEGAARPSRPPVSPRRRARQGGLRARAASELVYNPSELLEDAG